MDYERALEILRRQVERTESYEEFLSLEIRLQENLKEERIFSSTERVRQDRYKILSGLNQMSLRVLGCSFNDLVLGRAFGVGLNSRRIAGLLKGLEVRPTPEAVLPPVEPHRQELPFDELTPEQFELLCAALVAGQAHVEVLDCHLYGRRGDAQQGIDIVATQRGRDRQEIWVYQCKLYKRYTEGDLKEALAKITYPADYKVMMLGCEASNAVRDEAARHADTFLWDAKDISRRLKDHPQLVQDFFGPEWRKAFNP